MGNLEGGRVLRQWFVNGQFGHGSKFALCRTQATGRFFGLLFGGGLTGVQHRARHRRRAIVNLSCAFGGRGIALMQNNETEAVS